MATGGKDRQTREQRERARVYQARQELHRRTGARRRRDNLLALVVGAVVILGAVGAQTLYFTVGPGAPEPAVTDTPTPTPAPPASDPPAPDASETPAPETPAPETTTTESPAP